MIHINLLALRVPKDRLLIQKQVLSLFVLLLLSVVAVVWGIGKASSMKSDLENTLGEEKSKLASLESVTKDIENFEKKKLRREQILETIKKLEARKIGPRPFLDDLNMVLPPDIWITEVSESNLRITVSGYSFSNPAIADLMRKMDESPQFADVELAGIQNEVVQKENVKRFTLISNWESVQKIEEADKKPAVEADKNKQASAPKK